MRSRRYRRSKHPLTMLIDASIDNREAKKKQISTGNVTSDLVSTVPAALMLAEFGRLIGDRVRVRLMQRGMLVIDDSTWERKTDQDVTDVEFKTTIAVKADNAYWVNKHLKADRAVEKFLDKQATKLGRPVTMGEFETEIDKIYASHGF